MPRVMPAMYRRRNYSLRSFRRSGSSTARRARGNMRAALQMRDQSNVTLQGIVQVPITVNNLAGEPGGARLSGAYASVGNAVGVSIWQLAFMSQFYTNYKNMYDQMKLNGFRCKILGNSASTLTMASGLSSVSVVTAFDRNGIKGSPFSAINPADGSSLRSSYLNIDGGPIVSVNQVLSYGSAKSKPWSPGNSFNQYVSGYAQTAQETQQWISTDKLKSTLVSKTADNRDYYWSLGYPSGLSNPGVFSKDNDDPEEMETADNKYTSTSAVLASSPIYWDPVLLLGVYNVPKVVGDTAAQVFTFTVEYKIDVSFRGTRSGTISDPAAERVQGNEILQTLNIGVDPGEQLDLNPAEGTVWNHAIIEGREPTSFTCNLGTLHAGDVIDREPPVGMYYDKVVGTVDVGGATVLPTEDAVGVDSAGNLLAKTTDVWPGATADMFTITSTSMPTSYQVPTILGDTFPRVISLRVNPNEYFFPTLRATLSPRYEAYIFNEGPYGAAYIEVPPPEYPRLVKTFTSNTRVTGTGNFSGYDITVNTAPVINLTKFVIDMHHISTTSFFGPFDGETDIPIKREGTLVLIQYNGAGYYVSVKRFNNTTTISYKILGNTAYYVDYNFLTADDSIDIYSDDEPVLTFDSTEVPEERDNDWLYLSSKFFKFYGINFMV